MSLLNSASISGAKLTSDGYLRKHHVLTYMEDALTQLILSDNAPRTSNDTAQFLADYFSSVINGSHITFRKFNFIMATPHNRVSFLRKVHKAYSHLITAKDEFTAAELHSMLLLLCTDVPLELIQRCLLNSGHILSNLTPFDEFVQAFELQLYLDEFIGDAVKVYRTLQALSYSSLNQSESNESANVVVVPGANPTQTGSAQPNAKSSVMGSFANVNLPDTVDSSMLRERLKQLVVASKQMYPMPPLPALDTALPDSGRIKFPQFFNKLSEAIFRSGNNSEYSINLNFPRYDGKSKKKYTVVSS